MAELDPISQLMLRVVDESELTPEQLRSLPETRRVVIRGLDGKDYRWEKGAPPPGAASAFYMIVAIFYGGQGDYRASHRPGDYRVYCVPTVTHYVGTSEEVPYGRYILNTSTGDTVTDGMSTPDTFVTELANEYAKLAEASGIVDDGDEDDEDDDVKECPTCATETALDVKFCPDCGTPMPMPVPSALLPENLG